MVELCAGTAALSLRLHRDGARPPVSRMGAKTGYADVILRVLGLIPGQRADRYLWCEPDPGVRLLLHAYRSAPLAKAAAAIIRGWAAEDPRALWERLRAEGPPRLPEGEVDAGEVARFVLSEGWGGLCGAAFNGPGCHPSHAGSRTSATMSSRVETLPALPATITPDARHIDPREVARWAQITASNRLIHTAWNDTEGRWANTGNGGATFGGAAFCSPPERTAEGFDAAPGDVPAVVVPDAREVDPREVARFIHGVYMTHGQAAAGGFRASGGGDWPDRPPNVATRADHLDALPTIDGALIRTDARDIDPPALPPGTVVFIDPPYLNTTGYAHDLPRAEVVALARRWAAAGATVAISEAEAIPELVAEGWHAVRIDGERVGQKRTFSKQQAEWLTLSRPPAWVPPVQGGLFGGGR
jgi:hypothetical protein